jgi:hypothetical protein
MYVTNCVSLFIIHTLSDDEVTAGWGKEHNGRSIVCTIHINQILLRWSNQGEWDRRGICHTWSRWEMLTKFWLEINKDRDNSGISRRRRENNIQIYLKEIGWKGVDWILLAQDRDRRRASVHMVMNLRVLTQTTSFTFTVVRTSNLTWLIP